MKFVSLVVILSCVWYYVQSTISIKVVDILQILHEHFEIIAFQLCVFF